MTARRPGATVARLQLLGAAALFSTGGLAIKLCALSAWQVASFRALVGAATLAIVAPAARRAWNRRTLLVALPYAATVVLFTLSNRATTAANAIFLQDTAPLYVLMLGPWLLGEHLQRRDLWFVVAMVAGLALLFLGAAQPAATAPLPALGNVLAAVAGISWALTLLGLRWLAASPGGSGAASLAGALAGNLLAAGATLPLALTLAPVTPTLPDAALVLYLGVFQIGAAYVLISRALPEVPALEASLLLLAEPVLVPIWAWLLIGEATGPAALAGGAIILLATALHGWQAAREATRLKPP